MKINYERLSLIATNSVSRGRKANDTSEVLSSYLQMLANMIYANEKLTESEMAMIVNSINRWITRKDIICNNFYGIGKIVQLDWGINYAAELSYKHPAVILEEWKNTILVIPTTSTASKITAAYHPTDNPTGKWYYRKVGKAEGFEHDCVLILNNAKIMSKTRIISVSGSIKGDLNDNNSVFREVRNTMIKNLFQKEWIVFQKTQQKYEELKNQNKELQEKILSLTQENEKLKTENNNSVVSMKSQETV